MSNRVIYRHEAGVASVILDDGKVNVMSPALLWELHAALDQALQDRAIVVLRSGRPGIFSAGFDLKVLAANDPEQSAEMVKAGAELALRLLSHPFPTVGIMEGHAFPMGTFLLLGCDVRIGVRGPFRMGLNEVAIGITPPGFAIELARSRLHPAWLSRTVTLGEMYEPDAAVTAGFLDRAVAPDEIEAAIDSTVASLRRLHGPSHAAAKLRLRHATIASMRAAIDEQINAAAYAATAGRPSTVVLPSAR